MLLLIPNLVKTPTALEQKTSKELNMDKESQRTHSFASTWATTLLAMACKFLALLSTVMVMTCDGMPAST